jgi:tRNA nucleotidyltransferase (CCA-adding enzyme)
MIGVIMDVKEDDLEIVEELSDVYGHSLRTMNAIHPRFPLLRFAALLHDIGKVDTKRYNPDKQDYTFYDHETKGANLIQNIAKRLRFSTKDTEYLTKVVQNHMYFVEFKTKTKTLKRWMAENPYYRDNLRLRFADRHGNITKLRKSKTTKHLLTLIRRLRDIKNSEPALKVTDLAVNGKDIMLRYNLPPSPKVGKILNKLMEYVLDHDVENTKVELFNVSDNFIKELE